MGTKSRESIYGSSIRASAERAREARKEADRLACHIRLAGRRFNCRRITTRPAASTP
jgi:hypothetical protein